MSRLVLATACVFLLFFAMAHARASGQTVLSGHVPRQVAGSQTLNRLPPEQWMRLAIGLPLRNRDELNALLNRLADPSSPFYRQYLTPAQFTAEFGPTTDDYQALQTFLREQGLPISGTYGNRMLLDVTAPVADVERVLHVRMMHYRHPLRGDFYAPDREPSFDFSGPILDISGLDNFAPPRPMSLTRTSIDQARSLVTGSGPSGYFLGHDFRAAYAPEVSLTGEGQTAGLLEFDGFYPADQQANAAAAGTTPVPTQTILLNGFNGRPGSENIEVMLDIMMASYMAPGLSKILVYEGLVPNDLLNRMATDNLAQQLSSSWNFGPVNATTEQIYKEFAAQGQSMLQSAGDHGAYTTGVAGPSDDPNLTVVGGTSLTTAGAGGPWQAETTWPGSGGGVSTVYALPGYQQGLDMAANGGSTTMRNLPDVAMIADLQMYLIQSDGQAVVIGGTSAATPLWAGFIALANQQAAMHGNPRLGFLNPLLYRIGMQTNGPSGWHDIRTGNNGAYAAAAGYDLATGWGSPTGQPLIDDLTGVSGEPGFQLVNTTPLITLHPVTAGTALIYVKRQNGFRSNVALRISGLPAGVAAVFQPATTATTTRLTISASAAVSSGTYPATIYGFAGRLSSLTSVLVNVVVPGFELSPSTTAAVLVRGDSATSTFHVIPRNGFTGNVSFSASGMPAGVTATFSQASSSGDSMLTLRARSTAGAGVYDITIRGEAGLQSATATARLTIVAPKFSLALAPATLQLAPGFTATATVTMTAQNNFHGIASLALDDLPDGLTAHFIHAVPPGTLLIQFAATQAVAPGNYVVRLTATSGAWKTTQSLLVHVSYQISAPRQRP